MFFVEYWKTFGEYKYYLKKIHKDAKKIKSQNNLLFSSFFHFLLFLEFYLYLHRLIYCTKYCFCFFPRDKVGRTSHFVSQNQQRIKANFLFTILNFLRHQILNYCIQRKTTLIIVTYILKFLQKIILKCCYYKIERVLIIFVLVWLTGCY